MSRAEPVGRADSPERACAAALTARPWGHQSWEPLLQAGGTSGSGRGLLWKPPLQPPSEEGEALHQQAPAAPPRSFHAGPSLATLPDHAESGGPRDPSGSACDLCKRPRSGLWIPGSVLLEPFCTLSPGPPPLDTGPHPQGPMTPWGSLVSCLLCFSPARPLSQFLHFRPHGWDKPGSLDTWQAEGPPPSWSSRPFCGLGLATAHSCASSTLHNFCWVRGQMHTQPHVETHGFAERRHGVHARDDALSPHVPAAPESSAPDRGCPAGLRWFPSLLRLERDHRGP